MIVPVPHARYTRPPEHEQLGQPYAKERRRWLGGRTDPDAPSRRRPGSTGNCPRELPRLSHPATPRTPACARPWSSHNDACLRDGNRRATLPPGLVLVPVTTTGRAGRTQPKAAWQQVGATSTLEHHARRRATAASLIARGARYCAALPSLGAALVGHMHSWKAGPPSSWTAQA